MPKTIQTSGDAGLDRELDALWKQLAKVQAAPAPAAVVAQRVPAAAAASSSGITVQDTNSPVDSVPAASAVVVDTTGSDLYVAQSQGSVATVSRHAQAAVTPAAVGASASKGTSTHAANADHAHALGIVTTPGDLVVYGSGGPVRLGVGANGQVLTADSGQADGLAWEALRVPVVTSDPVSPAAGQIWYRSDTSQLSVYTGSATRRVTLS